MEPHVYAFAGALIVAFVALVGSIFVAERYMNAAREKDRSDRLLNGIERLLQSAQECAEAIQTRDIEIVQLMNDPNHVIDKDKCDLNFVALATMQKIYAPHSNAEMERLAKACQEYDKHWKSAFNAAAIDANQKSDRLSELQSAAKEMHTCLGALMEAAIVDLHGRELVFERPPSTPNSALLN